jgi:hypothetical protein
MVCAEDGAFHKAEAAFGRVDMGKAAKARILIRRMVHGVMVGEFPAYFFVGRQFISHQVRLAAYRFDDLFAERFGFDVVDVKRTAFAVTFDQRHDSMLLCLFLSIGAVLGFAADLCFVALDNLTFATDWAAIGRCHRFADAMAHKPA